MTHPDNTPPNPPNLPRPQHNPQQPSPDPAPPGAYPYPPHVVNVSVNAATGPPKNPGTATLLAALFGPLGMLYATIPGAIVMFCANLVILVLGVVTFGVGLFLGVFTWIGGMIWAYAAAKGHNERLAAAHPPYPHPY